MSSTLYSGSAIHIIPDQTEFDPVVAKNESSDSRSIEKERELYLDTATIAYPSAGLGVIHNLAVNKQTHYNGHIDDVTCMAISADGSLAATGWLDCIKERLKTYEISDKVNNNSVTESLRLYIFGRLKSLIR